MPRREFLRTKCGAFYRPNQAKNQMKFPVLKHEKVAGFMPVAIHAFIVVALEVLDLREG